MCQDWSEQSVAEGEGPLKGVHLSASACSLSFERGWTAGQDRVRLNASPPLCPRLSRLCQSSHLAEYTTQCYFCFFCWFDLRWKCVLKLQIFSFRNVLLSLILITAATFHHCGSCALLKGRLAVKDWIFRLNLIIKPWVWCVFNFCEGLAYSSSSPKLKHHIKKKRPNMWKLIIFQHLFLKI